MPRCKRARLPHYDNHSCSLNSLRHIIVLYLVAIAWMYVVLMMSVAEALAPNGSLLGAAITFVFYGALPLALVLYLLGTPARRRAPRATPSLSDANQTAAAMRPVMPSRRNEKNRERSSTVHAPPPLTCVTPAARKRSRARPRQVGQPAHRAIWSRSSATKCCRLVAPKASAARRRRPRTAVARCTGRATPGVRAARTPRPRRAP